MSCSEYTPLHKTVILPAIGDKPPINATVKIHIKQMLTDGTVLSDSIEKFPTGHEIDLTNTHVLTSLIDELLAMVPGEVSRFLCKKEEMVRGLFSMELPPGKELVLEVQMLDWYGQDTSTKHDGSLRKIIREEGNSRGKPCWTGKCTCKLQKNRGREEEILFRLGDGASYGVLHTVELCLLTMARNEVCQLETPSETYHITLTAFEKEKQLYAINEKEVLKMAEQLKVRGNNAYEMNKLRLAQLYYDRCMVYIEGIAKSEQDGSCTDLLRICNLNLCLVYMKLENYPKVVSCSTTVLWTDRDSVKALYRRAQAYDKQGFNEEAINDLNRLLDIETDNEFAKRLLGVVKSNKKSRENQEKVNMRTIFQKIEENHALEAANAVPTVSVWDEATDTCPQELATEEAYSVYKDALDEEEKARQAEVAARKAEYEAANPSKKKKKRKKKKKAVISEVAITEMEEIKADEDKH